MVSTCRSGCLLAPAFEEMQAQMPAPTAIRKGFQQTNLVADIRRSPRVAYRSFVISNPTGIGRMYGLANPRTKALSKTAAITAKVAGIVGLPTSFCAFLCPRKIKQSCVSY